MARWRSRPDSDSRAVAARRRISLIDVLSVAAVLAVGLAIVLPFIQSAREAARRQQCLNNLKQITLAAHNYATANNVLPQGCTLQRPYVVPYSWTSGSLHVALLPYMEQKPLYDAVNFDWNMYNAANVTISGAGIGTLWCSSDGGVERPRSVSYVFEMNFTRPQLMYYTSYAGCAGTWWYFTTDPAYTSRINGLFYIRSATTYAQITDGLSQTIAFGERAHTLLNDSDRASWHWWTSGSYGDTVFNTLYPMNPFKRLDSSEGGLDAYISSASSFHGGGANFAFMDGSARFLKDSINTWEYDPGTGLPRNVTIDGSGFYVIAKGTRLGVYQALSTRNGSEVISNDAWN
jgi:prepilin-type processing-associated H-X9-DG protein